MSTALQLLETGKARVDMFFDREPIVTDWDVIRDGIRKGVLVQSKVLVLARLKSFEPLKEADSREHQHWIDQQILRLMLLQEAGKPLEANAHCVHCGVRPADPLHMGRGYHEWCLHCEEEAEQVNIGGSRGNCEYLVPKYNPRTRAWGHLYYWSHGHNEAMMFWLTDFYPTRRDAERAIWPLLFYFEWLKLVHNDMIEGWLRITSMFPMEVIMKMKLPMTPDQFREHVRSIITEDMNSEQVVMAYCVRDAMREHEEAESD